MDINKHLEMLGKKAEDKVTGFFGVVTSISFDLYGCIQVIVTPPANIDGGKIEAAESRWFDISRLTITCDDPVMDMPNFDIPEIGDGKKGPTPKPSMSH